MKIKHILTRIALVIAFYVAGYSIAAKAFFLKEDKHVSNQYYSVALCFIILATFLLVYFLVKLVKKANEIGNR